MHWQVLFSDAFPGSRKRADPENDICPQHGFQNFAARVTYVVGRDTIKQKMCREKGASLFPTNDGIFLTSSHHAGCLMGVQDVKQQTLTVNLPINNVSAPLGYIASLGIFFQSIQSSLPNGTAPFFLLFCTNWCLGIGYKLQSSWFGGGDAFGVSSPWWVTLNLCLTSETWSYIDVCDLHLVTSQLFPLGQSSEHISPFVTILPTFLLLTIPEDRGILFLFSLPS